MTWLKDNWLKLAALFVVLTLASALLFGPDITAEWLTALGGAVLEMQR